MQRSSINPIFRKKFGTWDMDLNALSQSIFVAQCQKWV